MEIGYFFFLSFCFSSLSPLTIISCVYLSVCLFVCLSVCLSRFFFDGAHFLLRPAVTNDQSRLVTSSHVFPNMITSGGLLLFPFPFVPFRCCSLRCCCFVAEKYKLLPRILENRGRFAKFWFFQRNKSLIRNLLPRLNFNRLASWNNYRQKEPITQRRETGIKRQTQQQHNSKQQTRKRRKSGSKKPHPKPTNPYRFIARRPSC